LKAYFFAPSPVSTKTHQTLIYFFFGNLPAAYLAAGRRTVFALTAVATIANGSICLSGPDLTGEVNDLSRPKESPHPRA
jgi:hypothetical protein